MTEAVDLIPSLKKEATEIQSYLELDCGTEPVDLVDKISMLSSYIARSGEMLATAKKILRKRKSAEISKTILAIAKESHLSATVQNALLDSICEEESFLVDWIERINRTATHQLDAVRSLLSYEKEMIRINKTGY